MIVASICLSDIPADKITKSEKNQKKYLSIVIDKNFNGADQFGNTHSVSIGQTKEERQAKTKKTYIGNGKEYIFENNSQTAPAQQAPTRAPKPQRQAPTTPPVDVNAINGGGEDDLPF